MEYENIIFELELLGGAEDLCAEKYLLPLQSGRLLLPARLTPNDLCYLQAAACLREVEEANRAKLPGYEMLVKGALLRFLSLLIAHLILIDQISVVPCILVNENNLIYRL